MKIAVCPGSFDPVTLGHLDIIRRASTMFDKVDVLVVQNTGKNPLFTMEERKELLKRVTADIPNVEVHTFEGLLIDYMKQRGANIIVKGLRAMSDFEYEFQMALTNRQLYPQAETVFLTTSIEKMYLSSSIVKQIAQFGGDISQLIPSEIKDDILKKFERKM